MKNILPKWLPCRQTILHQTLLATASTLLAIFFIFRTLFTDNPGLFHSEMLIAQGLNLLAYGGVAWIARRKLTPLTTLTTLYLPALVLILINEAPTNLKLFTFLMLTLGCTAVHLPLKQPEKS